MILVHSLTHLRLCIPFTQASPCTHSRPQRMGPSCCCSPPESAGAISRSVIIRFKKVEVFGLCNVTIALVAIQMNDVASVLTTVFVVGSIQLSWRPSSSVMSLKFPSIIESSNYVASSLKPLSRLFKTLQFTHSITSLQLRLYLHGCTHALSAPLYPQYRRLALDLLPHCPRCRALDARLCACPKVDHSDTRIIWWCDWDDWWRVAQAISLLLNSANGEKCDIFGNWNFCFGRSVPCTRRLNCGVSWDSQKSRNLFQYHLYVHSE